MATHLVDCPACACLIQPAEASCPFCGAAQRRTMMPAVLTLGLVLGLAAVSCNDKDPTTTSSISTTMAASTDTTAATDGSTVASTVDESVTAGPVAAYAGPPETEEESVSVSSPTENPTGTTVSTETDATETDATETDATETDATDTVNDDDTTTVNSVSAYAGAPGSVDPLDPPEDLVGR